TLEHPDPCELSVRYQPRNVGCRRRVYGATDFPRITDGRVGQGRVYAKVSGPLSYSAWLNAVRAGRSYVSEGKSHLMDFGVNGTEVGTNSSQVRLDAPATVHATVKAAGYLDPVPNPSLQSLPYDHAPYW